MDAHTREERRVISAQDRTRFEESLVHAEVRRERQLDTLGTERDDPVDAAQRETLIGLLADIRAARERLRADDAFGICRRCDRPIPLPRLELLPWATTCVDCTRR